MCESCEKRKATKVVVIDKKLYEVCEDCASIAPERAVTTSA